jgi:hypothetical protein
MLASDDREGLPVLTSCETCSRTLVPVPARSADVTVATVRGLREGPLVWTCPDGHSTRTIDVAAAIDEVVGRLDVATRRRLRGGLRCGACGADLVLPGRRAMRSVTVTEAGVPATRLTFDVPLLRCTQDAVENLPAECEDDLRAVVAALLDPTEPDAIA